jgi:hypothetical protein
MKFTMLFGRPCDRSCYASPVFPNRRRGLAVKSVLYNARMLEAFPDFVAAIQRRCITSEQTQRVVLSIV